MSPIDQLMTNKTRNKLKERLKYTQKWAEHFLDVEKHRSISKNARKALNKDRPFLGFIFIILYWFIYSKFKCIL